jgi:hypothetical protein
MRAGLVKSRPDRRVDYTDYYLLKKPATFMRVYNLIRRPRDAALTHDLPVLPGSERR